MSHRILIVDDEEVVRDTFARYLAGSGYVVSSAESAERALALLADVDPDLIITDLRMAGMDGLELVHTVRALRPDTDVIVVTGFEDMQTAIDAIRAGAFDYLVKPVDFHQLGTVVARCVRDRAPRRETPPPASAVDELVGRDPRMVEIYKLIGAVAGSRSPVLIRGETGTGKELVARAIHVNSPAADEPFVAINCSALPEPLLESELFGHVRGAFTGALQDRRGFFERAGAGTIFLDEIGDTTPAFQAKLLRVLQEREFFPVGSEVPRRTEARVIAATHRPLEELVESGHFRRDVYYRLRVVEIAIPPLRERRGDIPLIAQHLARRIYLAENRELRPIPDDVLRRLTAYDWPGNVRELENVLTRAIVLARGATLALDHIHLDEPTAAPPSAALPADARLDAVIAAHVQQVLHRTGGNKRRAARVLGISRSRLDRLIDAHDLMVPKRDHRGSET